MLYILISSELIVNFAHKKPTKLKSSVSTARTINKYSAWKILFWILFIATVPALSSCFTGIEGTKKITLSKDDKKNVLPSPEEEFFNSVTSVPIAEWEKGRPFIAADDRVLLIFDQQGLPTDPEEAALGGKTLYYIGIAKRPTPEGSEEGVILFTDVIPDSDNNFYNQNMVYQYDTGKHPSELSGIKSDQIPMLIDSAMVDATRSLLKGKELWTRSPLWYDAKGGRIPGKKYVPVIIKEIYPGNIVFPVEIEFSDTDGNEGRMYMNFGNSGMESRSFASLFYISDFRKRYPGIEDDAWNAICESKVKIGMTKTECKLALGNPSEVDAGHDYSQTLDLWHYPDGKVLWFEDGLLTKYRD